MMSHFERLMTLYFPLVSITYGWIKSPLFSMPCGLTWRAGCPIIVFGIEIRPLLGNTYMADRMNLVVDYEDQADWLQDSIVVENVISGQNHDQLIVELEQAVYDNTRSMFNPPSSHIRIMGFGPADSDVIVKRGVNFWVDSENIWAS